jgi:hypothetical protein
LSENQNHMLLFKYVSPDAAPRVLANVEYLSVRFGLPSTYNDPYELFLQPDQPLRSEEQRAFYDYFLGKVAEAPVACFSRRPDSPVMWAHYGREGAGICLAFDEDALVGQMSVSWISDIEYTDGPAMIETGLINHAYMTGKRRHTIWLLAAAHRAAYFRKRIDWQYEAERRMVVPPDAVEDHSGVLLRQFKPDALRYIILGRNTSPVVRELSKQRAEDWNVPLLELRIGKRTFTPFFSGGAKTTIWSGTTFVPAHGVCRSCNEPVGMSGPSVCEWCSISEEARRNGPRRSMLTATIAHGLDEGLPLIFAGIEPRGSSIAADTDELNSD